MEQAKPAFDFAIAWKEAKQKACEIGLPQKSRDSIEAFIKNEMHIMRTSTKIHGKLVDLRRLVLFLWPFGFDLKLVRNTGKEMDVLEYFTEVAKSISTIFYAFPPTPPASNSQKRAISSEHEATLHIDWSKLDDKSNTHLQTKHFLTYWETVRNERVSAFSGEIDMLKKYVVNLMNEKLSQSALWEVCRVDAEDGKLQVSLLTYSNENTYEAKARTLRYWALSHNASNAILLPQHELSWCLTDNQEKLIILDPSSPAPVSKEWLLRTQWNKEHESQELDDVLLAPVLKAP